MQKQLRREERTDHPEINRAMDYIQQHYDQPITVKRLAKVVAMDENYLSMLFKKKTGKSLISYIHRVRIEHAKTLLTGDEVLSVSEIAETVGFSSDNYFIKIFKRYTALTPSQFRQSYRMNERAE